MNPKIKVSKQKYRTMRYFIDATKEIAAVEGIDKLTIRNIADRAGYNSATIYNYFESKTELLQYLIVQIFDNMGSDFKMNYDNEKSAIENLEDFFYQSYSNFLKHKIDVLFVTEIKNYLSYRMKKEEYSPPEF